MYLWAFSFNLRIDGGPSAYYHFNGIGLCCVNGTGPEYNFTFYDIQSLTYGDHVLDLALLDSGNGLHPNDTHSIRNSRLLFDYAVVNNANSSGSATPAIGDGGLSKSDKITLGTAIGIGLPSLILAGVGVWFASKGSTAAAFTRRLSTIRKPQR